MNNTIVSAFMTKINKNSKSFDNYIEYGKKLLNLKKISKIIFIERHIYEEYFINEIYINVKFIFFEKKDNYLYEHYDKISNFSLNTNNNEKDTIDYMFVQCHKTEWLKKAIELNPFNSIDFIWVDFGIYHICKDIIMFKKYIYELSNKKYKYIRNSSCWDIKNEFIYQDLDIYKTIHWYFAGGVLGGNSHFLTLFANLMKEKCIQIINDQKHIMWEVNIWYLICKEYPEIFMPYICGHDISIIKNY